MTPRSPRTPADGARYCREVAVLRRRAQETQRIVSVGPAGLYPTAGERAGWGQAAARWDARAELLEWAAAAPAERLTATLTQLVVEGLRDDMEGWPYPAARRGSPGTRARGAPMTGYVAVTDRGRA